jgi:hypothetical protein
MSENAINAALRGLGYAEHEMAAHGFPSMTDRLLNETGLLNPYAIERQLAYRTRIPCGALHARDSGPSASG